MRCVFKFEDLFFTISTFAKVGICGIFIAILNNVKVNQIDQKETFTPS
jgi:hypothetical protein